MLGVPEGVGLSPTHPELASRCPGLSGTWALPDGEGRVPACAGTRGWHRAVCREQRAGNAVTVTVTAGPGTPTPRSHPSSAPLCRCPRGCQVPGRYLGDGGFVGQALEDRGVVVAVLHDDRQLPGGLPGAGEGEGHGVQPELWSRPASPPGGDVWPRRARCPLATPSPALTASLTPSDTVTVRVSLAWDWEHKAGLAQRRHSSMLGPRGLCRPTPPPRAGQCRGERSSVPSPPGPRGSSGSRPPCFRRR